MLTSMPTGIHLKNGIYSLRFAFENNPSKRGFIRKISDLGISWYYSKIHSFSHVSLFN